MTNIKEARTAKKLSQKQVALELKVSAPTVSEWESGKKKPNADNLCQLSELFSVSVDYLLGLTAFPDRVTHKEKPIAVGDELTPSERDLIDCYRIASSDDRIIVDSALRKYSKKEQTRDLA